VSVRDSMRYETLTAMIRADSAKRYALMTDGECGEESEVATSSHARAIPRRLPKWSRYFRARSNTTEQTQHFGLAVSVQSYSQRDLLNTRSPKQKTIKRNICAHSDNIISLNCWVSFTALQYLSF
jgi:hypothetical protein